MRRLLFASQHAVRFLLGAFMLFAGIAHLTFARAEFQAQVPSWMPLDTDFVVVTSGVVEVLLGLALLFLGRWRLWVGVALAVFYVLIFPGNIAQYLEGNDGFGLDTDRARLIRLLFQPVLVLLALWAAGLPRLGPAGGHASHRR